MTITGAQEALAEVAKARSEGRRPYLSEANLSWANLSGADLRGANLSRANLTRANLSRANLSRANLSGAYLSGAYLREADLTRADLYGADLYGADLRGANLSGADLRGADLSRADLRGAKWHGIQVNGLPSGRSLLVPLPTGWRVEVGCWSGSVADLRTMVLGTEWPESREVEQERRRPGLLSLCDLYEAHIAAHPNVVPDLAERWG